MTKKVADLEKSRNVLGSVADPQYKYLQEDSTWSNNVSTTELRRLLKEKTINSDTLLRHPAIIHPIRLRQIQFNLENRIL